MCVWAGVSESGFYNWRKRQLSRAEVRRNVLAIRVKNVFNSSNGTYGYRRVHSKLSYEGVVCSDRLVRRVMVENNLRAGIKRKPKNLTKSDGSQVFNDIVKRNFTVDKPGELLVGDITEIRTVRGKFYLATVIDLYNREVVGYNTSKHPSSGLTIGAIEMGWRNKMICRGAVFHSDHGCQYTSKEFKTLCNSYGITQSMGRVGSCYDNACAESFFATLKKELIYQTRFTNPEQAARQITRWIELWYNQQRLHSKNGGQPPKKKRQNYYKKTAT